MKVVVIGGTGHTGHFLVERLVEQGDGVVCVSHGDEPRFLDGDFWSEVEQVELNRWAGEDDGSLGELFERIQPDAVVDIVCFMKRNAEYLVQTLAGKIELLVHIGSGAVHGEVDVIPTPETHRGEPIGDYARYKLEVQDYYVDAFARTGFPVTVLCPTQIIGPGKPFTTPGGHGFEYVRRMRAGEKGLPLPAYGRQLIQPVHPADVAQGMWLALQHPQAAAGEVFNIASAYAITYRRLFDVLRDRLGTDCTARPMSLEAYEAEFGPSEAMRQMVEVASCLDVRKAQSTLGYTPVYTSEEAVIDALDDAVRKGLLDADGSA